MLTAGLVYHDFGVSVLFCWLLYYYGGKFCRWSKFLRLQCNQEFSCRKFRAHLISIKVGQDFNQARGNSEKLSWILFQLETLKLLPQINSRNVEKGADPAALAAPHGKSSSTPRQLTAKENSARHLTAWKWNWGNAHL